MHLFGCRKSRHEDSDTRLKLIRLADLLEEAQTGPMQCAGSSVTYISGDKDEMCISRRPRKSNNKAAERKSAALLQCCSVGIQTLTAWLASHFFLTLVPTAICCPGHRYGTFALPPRRNDGTFSQCPPLLSFRLVPGVWQRSLLSLQIETCAPFNFLRGPLSLVSRLSCLHTFPVACRSRTLTWSRLRALHLDGLQDWARAGTIEPSSPII